MSHVPCILWNQKELRRWRDKKIVNFEAGVYEKNKNSVVTSVRKTEGKSESSTDSDLIHELLPCSPLVLI